MICADFSGLELTMYGEAVLFSDIESPYSISRILTGTDYEDGNGIFEEIRDTFYKEGQSFSVSFYGFPFSGAPNEVTRLQNLITRANMVRSAFGKGPLTPSITTP